MLSPPPLTKVESAWLVKLEKLLQACPTKRLEAAADCGNVLVIFDKDIVAAWDLSHRGQEYHDWDLQRILEESGAILKQISTGIALTHA